MTSSRLVRVGRQRQIVTTRFAPGKRPLFTDVHEHVTLETPRELSDTQRLRATSLRDPKAKSDQSINRTEEG